MSIVYSLLLIFFSKSVEEQQDFSENYWVGKLVRHELAKFYYNLILKLISLQHSRSRSAVNESEI